MGYDAYNKTKSYKRKKKKHILSVVKTLFFFLFIFSSAMFVDQILEAKHEQDDFSDLAAVVSEAEQSLPMNETDDNALEMEPMELQTQPLPQYEIIYDMNSDFVGWLSIPNTNIDYPVMFTPDAPEYYLRRAFDKTSSQSGTPFIGESGNIDSDCLIIYGHNMKNDTMFGTLDNYADEKFWTENNRFSFNTLREFREYEVFAAIKTNVLNTDEKGFRYYTCSGKLPESDFIELVDWLNVNSLYDTNITPAYGEQVLILSTCSYHTENGRFLVAARRVT